MANEANRERDRRRVFDAARDLCDRAFVPNFTGKAGLIVVVKDGGAVDVILTEERKA